MLDFIKFCKEFNIPYLPEGGHHHCHEGWIQTHCPFCTDGTYGWHLGFSIEHGNINCWRCGSHSIYKYLSIILKNKKITVKQALNLYSQKSIYIPKVKKPRRRKPKKPPYMEEFFSKAHKRYLKQRRFNPTNLIKEWNLKATKGLSGKWSWRIIAPIYNSFWITVGYTGRAVHLDIKPKWKMSNNKDMSEDPKKLLYGIEKVSDRVLIVEGVGDVWRMGPGAVATLGIDWKVEQAFQLKNIPYRFIMFDSEIQAQKKAKELANWLAPFSGETEIISGLNTDPGNMSQKEANRLMKELEFI